MFPSRLFNYKWPGERDIISSAVTSHSTVVFFRIFVGFCDMVAMVNSKVSIAAAALLLVACSDAYAEDVLYSRRTMKRGIDEDGNYNICRLMGDVGSPAT